MSDSGRAATLFHSPTLSDWAHLGHIAGIKWGPGLSEVSHTADEWVDVQMVEDAASLYLQVIHTVLGAE
jgi:acetylornithine deacetylase